MFNWWRQERLGNFKQGISDGKKSKRGGAWKDGSGMFKDFDGGTADGACKAFGWCPRTPLEESTGQIETQ